MNIINETQQLRAAASKIDNKYMMTHSIDEWGNYYMNKIKPLEEQARKILIVNAGIEPTEENIKVVHHFMSEDNYGSPAEALALSPVSFGIGCRIGSDPESNLIAYIEEVELIKENILDK